MRITIDVTAGVHPLSGWMRSENGPPREFQGLVELLALLDQAADRMPDPLPFEGAKAFGRRRTSIQPQPGSARNDKLSGGADTDVCDGGPNAFGQDTADTTCESKINVP